MDADTGERLRPLDLAELLALDIKPRGMLLDPIIPEKALAMIYALRGTGKTLAALGIACAVASGGKFLTWQAPAPRRVLLVDGEMPAACLRERLARMIGATPPAPARLSVLAGDLIAGGVGNLASPTVQAELERSLAGVDLLILDNLASLTAALREDSDGWMPIQDGSSACGGAGYPCLSCITPAAAASSVAPAGARTCSIPRSASCVPPITCRAKARASKSISRSAAACWPKRPSRSRRGSCRAARRQRGW
jgi:hypothetical protein